ncbi:hypothetical protein LL965_22935 [Xanthomonas cassavae CFBP 4642]|uniref:Uncharacterized protein n=2 Tax=Xanthomonas cassavae TaxID=56450 RepID=A0ABS8HKN9_9XANT|nr:hypothetical protein [Xanthomonas cassavae]MCC4622743.1 hypothetical protein [Xanthomonas cassavae CFBP 4642]
MDAWSRWLSEEHSEMQLRAWVGRLRVFRFVRAAGGHAHDGDRLLAAFGYPLLQMLEQADSAPRDGLINAAGKRNTPHPPR